jgi:hypothetical protein
MQFFTSPEDLRGWVKVQQSSAQAATKLVEIVGRGEEKDIVDTCKAIYEGNDDMNASDVLYRVLAKHNLTQVKEGNMKDKMIKEAQIMRQPGEYPMDLKVCPKLPFSVGKRLISTYNCRHYCLDSIVFDEDPNRVYCSEAIWRRHVMDKFAREFKDKDGKWVGGYINDRFQIFRDDGGNQMELAHGERTRKPRPHQYSTERRLEEARGEKTTDLEASQGIQMVRLASVVTDTKKDNIEQIFDDVLEMKEAGIKDEDIVVKISSHYNMSIKAVASVYRAAMDQLARHQSVVYAYDNSKMQKTAILPVKMPLMVNADCDVILTNGQQVRIAAGTGYVVVQEAGNDTLFQVTDGKAIPAGTNFKVADVSQIERISSPAGEIEHEDAEDSGLTESVSASPHVASDISPAPTEEFAINDISQTIA